MQNTEIIFPRNRLRRKFSRVLLRTLLPLVFRVRITGLENLKNCGPALLAGNHSGFLEILLMIAYGPKYIEFIGSGDVPMDPSYRRLTEFYSFIPVNRGNVDRAAFRNSVDVLKQGGYLGIFPEGGIWEAEQGAAQKGVSWIAMQAQVPVIPVGVGGLQHVGESLKRFKRPLLTVGVGEPIPPVRIDIRTGRKEAMQIHAESVMNAIMEAIPADLRAVMKRPVYECFSLQVKTQGGTDLSSRVPYGDALAHLMFKPVLIRTFRVNLGLDVHALEHLEKKPSGREFATAADAVLSYLRVNPHFFIYRFGAETGNRIRDAFTGLSEVGHAHAEEPLEMCLTRTWMPADRRGERTVTIPSASDS